MIKTVACLPPVILQNFSRTLLQDGDMWEYSAKRIPILRCQMNKKYMQDGRKMQEFEELRMLFEELYEWKKTEKAYNKSEAKDTMQRPSPPIEKINRIRGQLGIALRNSFKSYIYLIRKNNEIQKV